MNGHKTFQSMLLVPVLFVIGCAARQSAFDESPAKRLDAAPMAEEMEMPLRGNGAGALPRVARTTAAPTTAVTRQTQDPAIPERATVNNAELYGDAFPGLNADLSRGPDIAPAEAQPASAQSPADMTQQQLQSRIREMEAKIAEIEGRPPQVIEITPENVESRFLELEGRLAEIEGAAHVPAAPPRWVDTHVANAADADYLIGAGDLLEFYSFDDETLNREVTVRYDGHISLPLIADQRVADMTRAEAELRLRTAYERVFRSPQLSLIVRDPLSKTFLVMGDVASPGRYPYTRATTLVEAVTLAGGLRQRNTTSSTGGFIGVTGQLTKAFVVREVNGERQVYDYDLRHMGQPGSHASEAQVYYGDIVYVPEGVNLVYLLGESRNPVIVELTEGMTLLQLLALSGGFNTSTARLRSVVLLRQTDRENTEVLHMNVREMLKTGRDFPLQPGDIVYIPRRQLVRLEEFVSRITGSITPVIDMYLRAVDAYYINDINRRILEADRQSNTLRILNQLEGFGASTRNLVELFGRP